MVYLTLPYLTLLTQEQTNPQGIFSRVLDGKFETKIEGTLK